jgi:hypothetical protein
VSVADDDDDDGTPWRNEATMSAASKARSYEHCSSKFGFCWKKENLKILVAKGTFQIGKMTTTRCEECDTLQYP